LLTTISSRNKELESRLKEELDHHYTISSAKDVPKNSQASKK
jgi:hypothetical protein